MKSKSSSNKIKPEKEKVSAAAKEDLLRAFCPVVALGASAGGWESFQKFFDRMPSDSGMAFVVIQHLDPNHDTLMPELLAKHTRMPVLKLKDGWKAAPNHVYVVTPNTQLTMEHCTLRIDENVPARPERTPIDHCFRSLAEDQEEGVVGIILSGTGTDGTLGLKAIKEHGGITLAQAPQTAKYDSMSRHAIASGFVDYVLAVEEMPAKVIEYVGHLSVLLRKRGAEAIQEQAPRLLKKIFPILRRHTSHDFSRYKQSTLIRRLQRRMQLRYLDSVSGYIKLLRESPEEVDALFKDLLIGVTQFFRDADAFRFIETKVVPELFARRKAQDLVRVWVPGCATGEEAYSLAILLAEQKIRMEVPAKIQVFGTDLDIDALELARKGKYPECIAEHVSAERLQRFFQKKGSSYEVNEEIRDLCVFSPHNLIKDPPFSRLDLISCRNLLIYLELDLQKRVLPIFHYALNPTGYLFLGPSENAASRSELFRAVDKKHRVFQRRPSLLNASGHVPMLEGGRITRLQTPLAPQLATPRDVNQVRTIERVILEDYASASVIVDRQGDILYFSGHTSKYLEPQAGAPTNKLLNMAQKNLRVELRTALYRAATTREEVVREHLSVRSGRETNWCNLIVRPLGELGRDTELFIVVFQEIIQAKGAPRALRDTTDLHLPIVQQLENELRTTREDLQTTIEELESSNEDLKSANEELLSVNEELQSANEELQTSKEEVQSANDELQRKNDELDAANADLLNFFQNTQVATLFVDTQLRIKKFTPALSQIFPIMERDVSRPLLEVLPELASAHSIQAMIQDVMSTQAPHDIQFDLARGRQCFMVRLNPYLGPDQIVQGAMLTFSEVTELKRAAREHNQLAAIVQSSEDAIVSKDLDGLVVSWNQGAEKLFGYPAQEMIGKPILLIIPPDRFEEETRILSRIRQGLSVEQFETRRKRKDGSLVDISLTVSPVRDGDGKIVGASKIARDITDRKKAEEAKSRLAAIIESTEDAIISKDLDGHITSWNGGAERIFGYKADEVIGKPISLLIPIDRYDEEPEILQRIRVGEAMEHYETVRQRKDNTLIDVSLCVSPIKNAAGKVIGASKIARDITENKRVERSLKMMTEKLAKSNLNLEQQVQLRTAELVQANSQLEALVYSMAHDLRAPLRSMQAFASILLEDCGQQLNDKARTYAQRIGRAAESMDKLLLDLLAFGQTARADLEFGPVELETAWNAALAQNAQAVLDKGAKTEITGPLPAVQAHEGTLTQVLANLLSNALKFVPPGVTPCIRFRVELSEKTVRLWVEDNGIGIAPEYHERIFRIFERLNRSEYAGTGIGLAIVRKGVERMGGRVGVESAIGQGSRFWVELPRGGTN